MSGVIDRFPLLLPVRNSVASYGASAVTRTSDRVTCGKSGPVASNHVEPVTQDLGTVANSSESNESLGTLTNRLKRSWGLKPLNDHGSAQGGGGLRRRGQASGGRHTHGGQCGKTGPPQRVWGNSGGDSRRCDSQWRPVPSPTQKEHMQGVRGGGHLPAPAPKEHMQGVRGGEHLPAPAPKEPMQGVRGGGHLPAPAPMAHMHGVRGGEHLPAPAPKEPMQGVRGGEHLPAPAHQEHMQGVRGGEPLPAPAPKEPMQGVRGGELLPAPAHQEHMQGVRGGEPLPAPAPKERMQGVRGCEHLPAPA
jgi:hypothetical protein